MTTIIPNTTAFKGDFIDIEMNFKRVDITGYSIRATIFDSNKYSYQKFNLSINGVSKTSSLAKDYKFKINSTEYTITTTASMSYIGIVKLIDEALGNTFTCELTGFNSEQDIKITHNTSGPEYEVVIEAGSTDDLLTLLSSTPSDSQGGIPHVIKKGSENVSGGSSSQITWVDTRAGYQEFGLSIDSSSASSAAAQDYNIIINDDTYTVTLTLNEIYSSIVSKLNTALGDTYTCSIEGTSPTQDIKIIHNTLGDDNDVVITAGDTEDLLTMLNSTPDTSISGFTNKGWYNIYIDDGETEEFTTDSFIEIEIENLDGNKISQKGYITLLNPYLSWNSVS